MPYTTTISIFVSLCLLVTAYFWGVKRAIATKRSQTALSTQVKFHSLPGFHGAYVAIWCAIPSLVLFVAWQTLRPNFLPQWLAQDMAGLVLLISAGILGLFFAQKRIASRFKARHKVETAFSLVMLLSSLVAVFTTFGVVVSLVFETMRFFSKVSVSEFLFGLHWSPQIALRADQVASSGSFGAVSIFAGTLLITAIAMLIAVPIGLFSAIYMSEYATPKFRTWAKPLLEILAGIPTVVYGFFAALTIAPFMRNWGFELGLEISSESAMAAGLVMGVMIIPFVSSLSDDVINAVPQTLRDGSAALGATKSETIRLVLLPAALPGIVSSVLLATSRAIGETMIVVMAAGLAANLTANPFQAVTTVTVQILTLLVGDQEFDSPKTLAAFALGFVLFLLTLGLNILALKIVNKYREKYD
ncbi:MAG: phosphate ABC transporter permease subunit PstC [Rhizobiales bacterium]|nr:phosphate ABC transporter permease subunit PstC [Hyphomicrobiales bacterium]NRB14354.1 phosphate ABC transporter permease subunit PstC [Hyphomicrobiales bacterium]